MSSSFRSLPALPFVIAVLAVSAPAQITLLSAPSIDGAQETPPNGSAATGSGCFVLDQTAHTLSYNISYGGLGSPEIAAHIHTGAPGVAGGVTFIFGAGSPKIGSFATTPAQEATILAGNMYVNIHTNVFGGGEIRGQIVPAACPSTPPGNPFCTNGSLGTDHTTGCPCGNTGAAGNGCGHSFDPNGANMSATGSIASDTVVLHSQFEPASSFTLMMQHGNSGDAVFHDGVLCAANPLIRLRGRAAVGGEAFFPNSNFAQDSTTTLSARGGTFPGSGATMRYAAWFRNASTTFCPPATANVSNGWQITW